MMIFYKFWRETRVRFLLIALGLAVFCIGTLWYWHVTPRTAFGFPDYELYIHGVIYSGELKGIFTLLITFLGLGGLLRERARNIAFFTLSLPVSRARLAGAHIAVVLAELAVLSLIPVLLIPVGSLLIHQTFPVAEALRWSLLWFTCGSVIVAASFLFSVVLRGEYTAPVACFLCLFAQARISQWRSLTPYPLNILRIMGGRWDWVATVEINQPIPWTILSVVMLVALTLFAAGTRIMQKQSL